MEQLSFEITAELNKLNRGLDRASAKIDSFSKRNEKRLKQFGKSMTNVGKQMTVGLTVPLALLAGQSIRTFASFDDQMRKVGVTAGATGSDLEALTDVAKELGATTRFSARQAASGLEFMALAGFNTEQSIAAIPDVLNLAAAAALDLGSATDIVTDTMSAFQIKAENASEVSDVFAATQSKANTSVLQLGEAFKLSAANANSFGTDVATASAILGKLADAGIKGSIAGTTLNAIFRDIKDSAENNILAINGQNIALADSEGNFRDILDVLEDVEKATSNLSQAQKSNALDAIFQERSIRGVNTIMAQGVKQVRALRKELRGASGTAKSMADEMEGGLGGSLRSLKATFESLTIELGELLEPAMERIIKVAKNLINGFKSLDDSTKRIILVVAGLAAAIGPLLVAVGGIIQALPVLISGFAALTGPIGLVIAGVVALTAGLVALTSETEKNEKAELSLNSVRRQASKEIAKEKAEVEELLFMARDEKLSKDQRIKAIEKLNAISPEYLGNLNLETINTDKAREAVEKYNEELLRTATVKAAQKKLQELEAKRIDKEIEFSKARKKALEFENEIAKRSRDNAAAEESLNLRLAQSLEVLELRQKEFNRTYEEEKNILLGIIGTKENLISTNKKLLKSQNDLNNSQGLQQASPVADQSFSKGEQLSTSEGGNIPNIISDASARLGIETANMEARLLEFSETANDIIKNNVANAFVGLGEIIGNALTGSGNVLESLGQLVLGTMGNILVQLGQQAIMLGLTVEAVKKSLLSFGGLGAIAIGTAAVALGSAFKNRAKQIGSNLGSGGTGASVGGNGVDNNFTQSFSSSRNNEIILRARGRDLVAVLNAQSNFNNALG